jgi:hypothetical protein
MLTGVGLNPGGDFSSADIVEKGDILAENGGEIGFTEALGGEFRSVGPDRHVGKSGGEHDNTCETCQGIVGD